MNTTCPQCKTKVLKEHNYKSDSYVICFYFVCPNCGMEFDEEMEKIKVSLSNG